MNRRVEALTSPLRVGFPARRCERSLRAAELPRETPCKSPRWPNTQKNYDHTKFEREDGILPLTLHSRGRDLEWGFTPHQELGYCFGDVAADPDNKVIILTDSGETLDLGIVNEVMPTAKLLPRAWELARKIRHRPALTTRLTRETMLMQVKRAMLEQLPYGLALEGLAACNYWPKEFAKEKL